ncbi:hypothetical protein [uncultured Anaerococcus sp.]|uniref:hypothetical protein n=1 Tax=uncultured Anaerococcus sp. TaxID=293428 RepID=UPI00288974B1|nr:hypothetical protein [uncultured Anaerococcus sp.]
MNENNKENNKDNKSAEVSKAIELFNEFYKYMDEKKGKYVSTSKKLIAIYVIDFVILVVSYMFNSILFAILSLFFLFLVLLLIYNNFKDQFKMEQENDFYKHLKGLLDKKNWYKADIISSLIDEALYYKDISGAVKNDWIDTLIQSLPTFKSLSTLILGAIITIKTKGDLIVYGFMIIVLFFISILFNSLLEDFQKNKAKDLYLYSKANCFDLYIGYLYRLRTDLAIEDTSKQDSHPKNMARE